MTEQIPFDAGPQRRLWLMVLPLIVFLALAARPHKREKSGRPHLDRPQFHPVSGVWEETPGLHKLYGVRHARFSCISKSGGRLPQV